MDSSRGTVFVVGTYETARAAGQDYQALKDLYFEINDLDQFDAVVVGRQDSGQLKLYKKPEFPTAYAIWAGAGLGLAAGLVTALVPDAATNTRLLPGATAGAGLGVVAAYVARGIGREQLEAIGERLDASAAALVVAVSDVLTDRVRAALTTGDPVLTGTVTIDTDSLADDARAAQQEARGGLDPRSAAAPYRL